MVSKLILLSLLVLLTISVPLVSMSSEAFNQSCQVSIFDPTFPSGVVEGQNIQVATTIGVQCAQWRTYYSARVDLLDRRSQHFFSTSLFQIGWNPNVTATVSNAAIAPQSNGPWALQLNLYIFEEGGEVANFSHVFDIPVGNAIANAQQTTSSASTTHEMTASTNQTSVPLETIPANTTTSSGVAEQFYILIALAIATTLCTAIILGTWKRPA
jgi:hypothetical protein